MINKKKWFGKIVIIFIFVLIINWKIEAQTNSNFNGIWVTGEEGTGIELRFNNGNFERFLGGTPWDRGTYTINNNEIVFTVTHSFGEGFLNDLLDAFGVSRLEPRWYSNDEFILAIVPIFIELGFSEDVINNMISSMNSAINQSFTYSMDLDTLILTSTIENTPLIFIYNKR